MKKVRSLLYPPFSRWRKESMVKTWVSSYFPKQEELENLCLVAVHRRNCKLWSFVHVTSKRSFVIDVSSWILTLLVVMQDNRRNNLPSNQFFSSWKIWWCKIQVPTPLHLQVTSILGSACSLFSLCFLYKSIFLLLLLCRNIISKAFRIRSWSLTSTCIWVCTL